MKTLGLVRFNPRTPFHIVVWNNQWCVYSACHRSFGNFPDADIRKDSIPRLPNGRPRICKDCLRMFAKDDVA